MRVIQRGAFSPADEATWIELRQLATQKDCDPESVELLSGEEAATKYGDVMQNYRHVLDARARRADAEWDEDQADFQRRFALDDHDTN
jgi:hypothetical protein